MLTAHFSRNHSSPTAIGFGGIAGLVLFFFVTGPQDSVFHDSVLSTMMVVRGQMSGWPDPGGHCHPRASSPHSFSSFYFVSYLCLSSKVPFCFSLSEEFLSLATDVPYQKGRKIICYPTIYNCWKSVFFFYMCLLTQFKYSVLWNNVGLNCTGPLICGFFQQTYTVL